MRPVVHRNEDHGRYEIHVDGVLAGVADYREQPDGSVVMPHTEIQPAMQGGGLGAVLVQGALDDLRLRGQRVIAQCWFVAQFIDDHPEYQDLLAA